MRLASFSIEGVDTWGVVRDDGLIDGRRLLGGRCSDLRSVIGAHAGPEGWAPLQDEAARSTPTLQRDAVQWLPVIPRPERILCIGLNYRAHVEEVGRELPNEPSVFVRLAGTLLADGAAIHRPRVSECLDFEGELAVVIGRGGRHIPAAQAMQHVAGYSVFNDVSVRDWQKHSVTAGKNFDATAPFGPWLVTADEVTDPTRLSVHTRLNSRTVQQAGVDSLLYPIPRLIEYLSAFTPLVPGDVIATGTPAGVGSGRKPPLWMKAGDRIEVEVPGIGLLSNPVIDEPAPAYLSGVAAGEQG